MGYWGQTKGYGEKNIDAVIRREFNGDDVEVIDKSSRQWDSVHYLAVRLKKLDRVVGFVCLTRDNGGYLNIKVMDESCGPNYYDAPKRLIKKLSEPMNEWAREWRETCLNKNKRG